VTRRNRVNRFLYLPSVAALMSMLLLAAPQLAAKPGSQTPVTTSNCQVEMQTIVTPEQLVLGSTADVTLRLQQSCPENRRPVDLVFLVDTSNSMTRGGPVRPGEANDPPGDPIAPVPPDPGKGDPPPPDPEPPAPFLAASVATVFDLAASTLQDPVPPIDPGDPPVKPPPPADPPAPGDPGSTNRPGAADSEPAGCIDPRGNDGGSGAPTPPGNAPIDPPPPRVPPGDPGDPTRPVPTRTPSPQGNMGGSNSGAGSAEPAGTEDLVRLAKQFIRDFVEQPRIEKDMADGSLRLGLVAFSDRGRRLVSLTSEGQRIATRTNLLRGGGKTRIDLGLRTAERVLIDPNRRRLEPPDLRAKVIVVISDAAFCQKDLRVNVNSSIQIATLLAGRSPWARRMRDVATDNAYVLNLRPAGLPDLLKLYERDFAEIRAVSIETLTIRGEIQPDMELVEGSMNPAPAKREGQVMEWTWTPPSAAVAVSFQVKPLQPGFRRIDVNTTSAWTDTEADTGLEHFPAYYVDVLPLGGQTPTPVEPTPTPVFAPSAP